MLSLKSLLKQSVKKAAKIFGYEIIRIASNGPLPFDHHKIDLVFDVGANTGQFARRLRWQGFQGRIVSFEPLPEAHDALRRQALNDNAWIIYPRCAIGGGLGKITINVSGNSYSSSALPMMRSHELADPSSTYFSTISAQLISLDLAFKECIEHYARPMLKIDVQGYEHEVLNGASESLRMFKVVQIELSTEMLYESQELYTYFFDYFKARNFHLWSIIPGFHNRQTGQQLQFDAIFVNQSSVV